MTDLPARMKPCEEAGQASVEEGVVLLDGPDGVAVTMTAEAAEGTAASLLEAAALIRKGLLVSPSGLAPIGTTGE